MTNIFKNMLKISIDIPYDNDTVYPTTIVTRDVIAKYCTEKSISYEFLDDNENDNMQVKLNDKNYEILRYTCRGYYGIKCRPI